MDMKYWIIQSQYSRGILLSLDTDPFLLAIFGHCMTVGRGISPLAPISGDWAYGSDTACHLSCGLPLFDVRWEHLFLFTCL